MLYGLSVIILRLMGVSWCFGAAMQLGWLVLVFGQDPGNDISAILYCLLAIVVGVGLIFLSRKIASKVVPEGMTDVNPPINVEDLISAGTALLGIYVMIYGLVDLAAPVFRYAGYALNEISEMSRDHNTGYSDEAFPAVRMRIDSFVQGFVKLMLGLVLVLFNSRVAGLVGSKRK